VPASIPHKKARAIRKKKDLTAGTGRCPRPRSETVYPSPNADQSFQSLISLADARFITGSTKSTCNGKIESNAFFMRPGGPRSGTRNRPRYVAAIHRRRFVPRNVCILYAARGAAIQESVDVPGAGSRFERFPSRRCKSPEPGNLRSRFRTIGDSIRFCIPEAVCTSNVCILYAAQRAAIRERVAVPVT